MADSGVVWMSSEEFPVNIEGADLSVALEQDRFKQFLDQIPIAVAVSELVPVEKVIYANHQFERLSGQLNAAVLGKGWQGLPGAALGAESPVSFGQAIVDGADYLGTFNMPHDDGSMLVDAWSSLIEDDEGAPAFRLVALVAAATRTPSILEQLEEQVLEKDTQLKELQHRVRNNLQMITALIRVEARGVSDRTTGEGFDRLAGRVEALGLLYRALSENEGDGKVDLGVYLSEIASAVMRAHAVEGVHLDLQVDMWPVSLDVAMPAGLVVNELMTNTLKHAFKDASGGAITLHCKIDGAGGCRIVVADDGIGLPAGYAWPKQGKLSALIVRSLLQNASARMDVQSTPGHGMRVEIVFLSGDATRVR